MSQPTVHVIYDGYSFLSKDGQTMKANCTCSVIKGPPHIIVDTMTAWDKQKILDGLSSLGLEPGDVSYAVATHGHSDHVGNLNLFTSATHVVGASVSRGDVYNIHNFDAEPYRLSEHAEVFATPGHTGDCVSVRVRTRHQGVVIIAGDLFEREEDLWDASLWRSAGSQDPDRQVANRSAVLAQADHVVPGHGAMFAVTSEHRRRAAEQA